MVPHNHTHNVQEMIEDLSAYNVSQQERDALVLEVNTSTIEDKVQKIFSH